ncbi:MAG: hypothetical protein KDK99_02125 [Verrucomicrobiales bacterium]|nr:hypothetical protein [Verrucomicrobiales bacterium]
MRISSSTLAALFLSLTSGAQARTWTSADGARTMEADLLSVSENQVRLRLATGGENSFDLGLFSEADRQFATDWQAQRRQASPAASDDAAPQGDLTRELTGKLVKWTGRRFTRYAPEGEMPQYYILYFAASW